MKLLKTLTLLCLGFSFMLIHVEEADASNRVAPVLTLTDELAKKTLSKKDLKRLLKQEGITFKKVTSKERSVRGSVHAPVVVPTTDKFRELTFTRKGGLTQEHRVLIDRYVKKVHHRNYQGTGQTINGDYCFTRYMGSSCLP